MGTDSECGQHRAPSSTAPSETKEEDKGLRRALSQRHLVSTRWEMVVRNLDDEILTKITRLCLLSEEP